MRKEYGDANAAGVEYQDPDLVTVVLDIENVGDQIDR